MFKDIKLKLKSATPSIRSVKSTHEETRQIPTSASTPVLSTMTSTISSPTLAHIQQKERKRSSSHSSLSSSISSKSPTYSRSSCQSINEENSSSSSPSMPPTPPTKASYRSSHARFPSNVSLPISTISSSNEYIMNHNHLKPGNNAELLSYNKTINMYRENAKRTNDPNIQCDLAMYLFELSKTNNPEERKAFVNEAAKILKTLALRGHAESQYYLANIFASGGLHKSGTKPDFGNAFPLFVQAAKHQHVDAAYR
jgi:TPR repeat protein